MMPLLVLAIYEPYVWLLPHNAATFNLVKYRRFFLGLARAHDLEVYLIFNRIISFY